MHVCKQVGYDILMDLSGIGWGGEGFSGYLAGGAATVDSWHVEQFPFRYFEPRTAEPQANNLIRLLCKPLSCIKALCFFFSF